MSRLLVFSPYLKRSHLNAYEGTIAKACKIRGADVEYLLCDGILPECDMHWDSFVGNLPRALDICKDCQAMAKAHMADLNVRYKWVGEYVREADKKRVLNWAHSLPLSKLKQAIFEDHKVGDWVLSSVVSYFRQYPPDFNNFHVVNVYRGFIYSASIIVIGIKNYLAQNNIDSALLFNGRQSITRVALEILKQQGVRVLTHEAPEYQAGHLNLKPNANCMSLTPLAEFWSKWHRIPLTRHSLEKTLQWLIHRRYGRNLTWFSYNEPLINQISLREKLNLSPNKKLMALFTSSTDEIAGVPEWEGPYESQSQWVQDVVNWVDKRNDVELVIRVHPNLSGKFGIGGAGDELNFYCELKSESHPNIRLILPDDSLNTYALTDQADIGLTFGSTVGIEMAMLGKPILLCSRGTYENSTHILTLKSRQSLPELLERCLMPYSGREIRREAYRMAYYYVFIFEPPFPLVSLLGPMDRKVNYYSLDALSPGQDYTLDNCCGFLLNGTPLYEYPTEIDKTMSTADEDAFFESIEKSTDYLKDLNYERWLPILTKLKWMGRSSRKFFELLPFGIGIFLIKISRGVYKSVMKWIERVA